jgi:hypothetical protein
MEGFRKPISQKWGEVYGYWIGQTKGLKSQSEKTNFKLQTGRNLFTRLKSSKEFLSIKR